MIRQPRRPPLFPYTPLFRSAAADRFGFALRIARDQRPRGPGRGPRLPQCPDEIVDLPFELVRVDEGVDPERAEEVPDALDRKSTRLNSSHSQISYAVFCLTK